MSYISSLFPVTDPTLIFFVVMLIVLSAPIIMGKLRIPHIVGMIIAGVIVGPHGLGILARDSSFQLLGNVGLYFIMFLAGLEMNMGDFRKNRVKTFTHGILTFAVPMAVGYIMNISLLKFSVLTAVLMASMYASHTLLAYPTVLRFGIANQRGVTIAVGATAITDTLTLLVLAIVKEMFNGKIEMLFWVLLFLKMVLVFFVIIFFFPRIARYFFQRYEDNVMQFIFVVAMTFFGASLMEFIGLEGILGAFLTGVVLNRYVPNVSPLMRNLEFVGNAVFIPYFLIGVGMMVNVKVVFSGFSTIIVAAVMIGAALSSKWLAALGTQKIFGLKAVERELIFGLSSARAGATLAIVMVGYNLVFPNGERLFNDDILNGTVILILVTCIISSVTTERCAEKIVLKAGNAMPKKDIGDDEKILIPMRYPEIAVNLVSLAIMMRNKKLNRGLIGLNVVYDDSDMRYNQERGAKLLSDATKYANSAGVLMQTQVRIAVNIANGIRHAFNEFHASEIIMGMHIHRETSPKFWGEFHQSLFSTLNRQITMARIEQPLNTIRRVQVVVPSRAQYEPGFYRWIERLARLAGNMECRMLFHGREDTLALINEYIQNRHTNVRADYKTMGHWNELPQLAGTINEDHLFVIIAARKGTISYKKALERLPEEITNFFSGKNIMIIFPDQYGEPVDYMTIAEPQHQEDNSAYSMIRKWIKKRFKI
jgi:Kef-type K+ transport system membrane component KefB